MKYIDSEKLIAEIERQKKHSQEAKMEFIDTGYNQNAFAEDCRLRSFDKLLSFITSLQQEQPEVDLDAEIAIYLNKNVLNRINYYDIIEDFTTMEAGELASHFYELGLNARKEE